jgi:hypothetical protein
MKRENCVWSQRQGILQDNKHPRKVDDGFVFHHVVSRQICPEYLEWLIKEKHLGGDSGGWAVLEEKRAAARRSHEELEQNTGQSMRISEFNKKKERTTN